MAHWKKYLEHFITYETEMMTKRVNKTVINLKKKKGLMYHDIHGLENLLIILFKQFPK